ncbi:MAG: 3-phosphoglycerate dehydrogenase [Chlorobi bacterium]|nr:3-phosphoglycerate dehydrogenase [Chlorobiota bacterium]
MLVVIADGLHHDALRLLIGKGYTVKEIGPTDPEWEEIREDITVLVVRSATKVTKALIDSLPNLRLIIRAGTGLDNIDVSYAQQKGILVKNTPGVNARSVAELTIAHILTLARNLHRSNREMPIKGHTDFKKLKKEYSSGVELAGKKLGIIGAGQIGKEVAKIALGLGMDVAFSRRTSQSVELEIEIANNSFKITLPVKPLLELVGWADFVSLHVPAQKEPLITNETFKHFKKETFLVNTSRGGVVDENALLKALDDGTLRGAALDVFEGEPKPKKEILSHPLISLSPHIGASTVDAQRKIGFKVVDIIEEFASRSH